MTVQELWNVLYALPQNAKVRVVQDGLVIDHRLWVRLEPETRAHIEELEEV